jgi:long-chain acyl-CoA synthetase
VLLWMENRPGFLELQFASWQAGLVAVPAIARLHPREIAHIAADSGAHCAFTSASLEPGLSQALGASDAPAPQCLVVGSRSWSRLADEAPIDCVEVRAEDAAWLFYTSGTTGKPKGVVLTPRNLRWMTLAYLSTVQPVQPGDCMLHPAPLSHGAGLYHLPYVLQGGVNVVPASGGLDAAEFFALASHWRNASCFAAPTIVKRLTDWARAHRPDTSGLATIVYGGAPMYLADIEAARAALGPHLAQIYGQGESPMTISVLPRHVVEDEHHPQWRARLASVGHAQPMVEIAILSEQGERLPTGTPGEVCVRGEVVMPGYWNQPAATAHAIRDGWLYTGDIGALDAQGFLTLMDRSKDLVISGGNNIYPREVEETLLTHPQVQEVGVIGRPDAEWGESLVAYVVARGPVSAQDLDRHCLAQLARYKRPKQYRFVNELPKNNYGKVLKTALREREAALRG